MLHMQLRSSLYRSSVFCHLAICITSHFHGGISTAISAKRVLLELTRDFIVDRPLNEVLPLLHRLMQAVAKLMTSK